MPPNIPITNLQIPIPNLQFEIPNCTIYPQLGILSVSSLINEEPIKVPACPACYNTDSFRKDKEVMVREIQLWRTPSHCTLHTTHCTLRIAYCTLRTAYCTLAALNCTLFITNCKHHPEHCKLYTAHRIMYTTHCKQGISIDRSSQHFRFEAPLGCLVGNYKAFVEKFSSSVSLTLQTAQCPQNSANCKVQTAHTKMHNAHTLNWRLQCWVFSGKKNRPFSNVL